MLTWRRILLRRIAANIIIHIIAWIPWQGADCIEGHLCNYNDWNSRGIPLPSEVCTQFGWSYQTTCLFSSKEIRTRHLHGCRTEMIDIIGQQQILASALHSLSNINLISQMSSAGTQMICHATACWRKKYIDGRKEPKTTQILTRKHPMNADGNHSQTRMYNSSNFIWVGSIRKKTVMCQCVEVA